MGAVDVIEKQRIYDEVCSRLRAELRSSRPDGALRDEAAQFVESVDPVARMATTAAVLHHAFQHYFWTGFYVLVDGELTVGPYQGSPACLVLEKHKGVCWAGIDREQPVVVSDVHTFPGHIACDGRANSEVVIPLKDASGAIVGVLDVDSADFNSFDEVDVQNLERILTLMRW